MPSKIKELQYAPDGIDISRQLHIHLNKAVLDKITDDYMSGGEPADAHPISAITGLTEKLEGLAPKNVLEDVGNFREGNIAQVDRTTYTANSPSNGYAAFKLKNPAEIVNLYVGMTVLVYSSVTGSFFGEVTVSAINTAENKITVNGGFSASTDVYLRAKYPFIARAAQNAITAVTALEAATQAITDNSTRIATTAFVFNKLQDLIMGTPEMDMVRDLLVSFTREELGKFAGAGNIAQIDKATPVAHPTETGWYNVKLKDPAKIANLYAGLKFNFHSGTTGSALGTGEVMTIDTDTGVITLNAICSMSTDPFMRAVYPFLPPAAQEAFTSTTQPVTNNSTKIATTAFAQNLIGFLNRLNIGENIAQINKATPVAHPTEPGWYNVKLKDPTKITNLYAGQVVDLHSGVTGSKIGANITVKAINYDTEYITLDGICSLTTDPIIRAVYPLLGNAALYSMNAANARTAATSTTQPITDNSKKIATTEFVNAALSALDLGPNADDVNLLISAALAAFAREQLGKYAGIGNIAQIDKATPVAHPIETGWYDVKLKDPAKIVNLYTGLIVDLHSATTGSKLGANITIKAIDTNTGVITLDGICSMTTDPFMRAVYPFLAPAAQAAFEGVTQPVTDSSANIATTAFVNAALAFLNKLNVGENLAQIDKATPAAHPTEPGWFNVKLKDPAKIMNLYAGLQFNFHSGVTGSVLGTGIVKAVNINTGVITLDNICSMTTDPIIRAVYPLLGNATLFSKSAYEASAAVTPPVTDESNKIATTEFVKNAIKELKLVNGLM